MKLREQEIQKYQQDDFITIDEVSWLKRKEMKNEAIVSKDI